MIDETLIWNAQVDKITKKVNSGLSILTRLQDIMEYQTLITIYLYVCMYMYVCVCRVLARWPSDRPMDGHF